METILKEFTYLSDSQFGCLVKICLYYSEHRAIPNRVEDNSILYLFQNLVKCKLDRLLKQRDRNIKNYNKKKEAQNS